MFRVKVVDKGPDGCVQIGIAQKMTQKDVLSAWECQNSFAIRCFDGKFISYKKSAKYAEKINNGDIVTILLDRLSGQLKFIINTQDFGIALESEALTRGDWYPTFGLQGEGEQLMFENSELECAEEEPEVIQIDDEEKEKVNQLIK